MSRMQAPHRGSIVILALVLLVFLLGCLAFAIDVGYLALLRTRLQVAADAGAMAGTDAMGDGATLGKTTAEQLAELNFNPGDPLDVIAHQDIELGTWDDETREFQPLTGVDEEDAFAVRVKCQRTSARGSGVNFFFANLLGTSSADVTAVAIARARASSCAQIIGLDRVTMSGSTYTDSYNSARGAYGSHPTRQRGHVCSNGPILTSGTTAINGNGHAGVGYTISGTVTVSGTNSPLTTPLSFPPVDMGDIATNNNNSLIPLTLSGAPAIVGTELVLSSGDSLDLPSGEFYFTGLTISTGATLNVLGRTVIYVEGDCYFSGGGIVNTTQKPSYLQLYCTGATCSVSGDSDFHGVIYAPTARIIRSGPSNICGMLLGRELNLSGTGGVHADEALGHLKGMPNRYTVLVD